MLTDFEKQISFIVEIDKLKTIQRKTRLFNGGRHENDAEHSWHLAMMVLALKDHANTSIDLLKVLKMVLIHDIVEIDAGDTFLFDTTKNHTNTDEEMKAAERIFGLLPEQQAAEYISLWKEFEDAQTGEARFAKAIDRLAPIIQNYLNEGGTWKEFSVPYETVVSKKEMIGKGSLKLWEYALSLLDESVENGFLKK